MDKEKLFNDGVNILKSIYRKYIAKKQIQEEDALKYIITLHGSTSIDNDKNNILFEFMSLCINQNNNMAYPADVVYVSLSDISINKIVNASDELLFNCTKPYSLQLVDYANYKEEISLLAELYYEQKSIDKFEKNSEDYSKLFEEYNKKVKFYTDNVDKLMLTLSNETKNDELIDNSDESISESCEVFEVISEEPKIDYYDQIINRLDAGNSEKRTYDFDWDETALLNYADDSSLEIAYNLIERGKISLKVDENKKGVIHIISFLYGFCDSNMTNEDYFKKCEENRQYNERKEVSTWQRVVGKPMNTDDCFKCKYQSCPKTLAAYILYLKNQGKLKEKLIARKEFRENNNVANGFFLFNWKNNNGLKKIDDKSFEFANELVNKDYVRVDRNLNKEVFVTMSEIITCQDLQLSNMDIDKLSSSHTWDNPRHLDRKTNSEPDSLCNSYNCRMPTCAIEVAGYIYYLKMSGQESKIKEDREYYASHKEEIDKEIKEKTEKELARINSKREEKIHNIMESYDGKIENLNLTINSIMESNKTNFHCIVVGDDKEEKNMFIEKMIRLLQNENNLPNVRKLPATHFAKLFYHVADIRINSTEKLVYTDKDCESKDKKTFKYDKNDVPYGGANVNRRATLEENSIYVLDDIKEFVEDFRHYFGDYDFMKRLTNAIDILTDMSSNKYIIINAEKDEVEQFISLDTRLKFVYQNSIINIPTYSIGDMYNSYIKLLTPDLVSKLRENEGEYKKSFNEYVGLNQKFLPFTKLETVSYLATYANTRNEIILPPNIYKKENLDNLIGLDSVKEKIKEFEKYMLFQIQAKANDIKLGASNMHMIFTGNPGTGKTTVARIMARMLFDLGIVKENKLVEVERKDLIAKYVGQTASKTAEVIDKAMGGVLFIDEAYSLAMGGGNDFGAEAIATLIKAMEDHKDDLVVIFAGYKNEMKNFTDINPGIASRIGYTFDFQDYSADELMEIFYLKLKKSGFEFEEDTDISLRRICEYFSKRKNFGNGRFVDKVIQETLMKHALSGSDNIKLIKQTDIPSIEELNQNSYKNNNQETAEEMLNSLIGMENIKKELIQFKNYASFVKKAEEKKLKIPDTNMHMIFTGNPGTGKTTIARIIAKILFDMEIIHENKLIEVEKKDLVGKYAGETAPKTNEVVERAMGGVLFIDEAYSLAMGGGNDLGAEAIATLIKAMEDHKGDLVVIFAGYRDEMKTFIDMNAGISSRIGYTFNFEDYSVKELMEIFYMKMKKSGFVLSEGIEVALERDCNYYSKRKNFGNGRFVDKLIQKTLLKHANRNVENVEIISEEDIPTIEELNQNTIKNNSNIEEMLSGIVGMKELKEEILSFGDYIAFVKEAEKQKIKIPDSNMHMIFTGNPGTGKTTVARIIAKMLFEMEIIHENKLIEVERKDLVAEYIGQTAVKTSGVIEKAMGGVLFVDEAYTLSIPDSAKDFGPEAIATLIKAMEDHKGEFVVIFAGYKEEMKRFIDSNPGISSRIGYTFDFKDYEPNELTEIFEIKVKKTGMILSDDAKEAVLKVMRYFSNVENFGNGRFVDKVFHQTIMKHSKKLNGNISIITKDDIPEINEMTKLMIGGEDMIDVRKITDEALRKTAVHEVGHATARYLLDKNPGIKKITINAEGRGTLGYVKYNENKVSYTPGKNALLNNIKIKLAGLACENVYFGEYESGGSSDIEQATNIAYSMITRLGMSNIGLAKVTNPSGEVAKIIYDEENRILKQCFEEVEKLLSENKEKIDKVVDYLIKQTEINEEEFIKVFNGEI